MNPFLSLFIGVIISIFLSLFLGTIFKSLYERINNPRFKISKRGLLTDFKQTLNLLKTKSVPPKKMSGTYYMLTPILVLIISLSAVIFISINGISNLSSNTYSILFVLSLLILIQIILAISSLSSTESHRFYSAKYYVNRATTYYVSILLVFISLIIQFIFFTESPNNFSFFDLITFQTKNDLKIFGLNIPALFLFINPFGAVSYCICIIGLLNDRQESNVKNEPYNLWNPLKEFAGSTRGFIILEENNAIFMNVMIFIGFFLGNGKFIEAVPLVNFLIQILLALLFIVFISEFGKGKPKIVLKRGILGIFKIPLILAALSIFWAFITIHCDIFQFVAT
ncbi:MAG: hypothetical protein GF364_00815 [Candidatus Lokiarchaeota archaeon]|nr:hypothetical protein [Candidatus Lokiarchaeota archaeon]